MGDAEPYAKRVPAFYAPWEECINCGVVGTVTMTREHRESVRHETLYCREETGGCGQFWARAPLSIVGTGMLRPKRGRPDDWKERIGDYPGNEGGAQ